jgi:hypothetical protein
VERRQRVARLAARRLLLPRRSVRPRLRRRAGTLSFASPSPPPPLPRLAGRGGAGRGTARQRDAPPPPPKISFFFLVDGA